MDSTPYDDEFYAACTRSSYESAKVVAPIVCDLVSPASVVDLGCGRGSWLAAFREHGVEDVLGVDGDYVDRTKLLIPAERFRGATLTEPLGIDRRFDLAMSLEVAEHLDARHADAFVQALVDLAPVVLFSAAVPFQGGDHHVNEQWQDYWAERFMRRDYVAVDAVRPLVWQDERVDIWYAQNTILYVAASELARYPRLEEPRRATRGGQLSLVHPAALHLLARTYARKTVTLSKLVRWRVRGMYDEDYAPQRGGRKAHVYLRGHGRGDAGAKQPRAGEA